MYVLFRYLIGNLWFNSIADTSGTDISQSPLTLIQVNSGDAVTLKCSYLEDEKKRTSYWYKQGLGQIPQVVGRVTAYSGVNYESQFNCGRFRIISTSKNFQLTITQTKPSDEAMYFCGFERAQDIAFGNGTFLKIQGNGFFILSEDITMVKYYVNQNSNAYTWS